MGFKRIAKLSKGCILGCDQVLDSRGETENDMFKEILLGELYFFFDLWPVISESAKDLIKKMLIRDKCRRITANEVLLILDLVNLVFCHQQAQENVFKGEEIAGLRKMFKIIDTDNNGCITFKKLKDVLKNYDADLDESGIREEIVGLRKMFKMIDTDNSGCITFKELKDVLKNYSADLDESGIRDLMLFGNTMGSWSTNGQSRPWMREKKLPNGSSIFLGNRDARYA
nr:hypothetical protein [Tanacetum cinerariifolium]